MAYLNASTFLSRTTGPDIYRAANIEALARLNRMGDLHTTSSRFDKHQAPVRSHSSLGFSNDIFRDAFGGDNSTLAGISMAAYTVFSGLMPHSNSNSSRSHASSMMASPMMYTSSMPSRDIGSQEPLDAYQ